MRRQPLQPLLPTHTNPCPWCNTYTAPPDPLPLRAQDPIDGVMMAGFVMTVNYLGVSNTNVRDALWTAARSGICSGTFDETKWPTVAATVPDAFPVLFTSAWLLFSAARRGTMQCSALAL